MKRFLIQILFLASLSCFSQLKDIKVIIPKDMGFSYGDFTQFFPDEKHFVICGNSVSVLNTETAEIIDEYDLLNIATNLSISPDGKYILVTSAAELLIFTFEEQKLKLLSKTTTGDLIQGLPNSQYYGALPIGGCFFTGPTEIYVCVGSFTLVYDLIKKTAVTSHAFPIGDYISVSASYPKKHEVLLAITSGSVPLLIKQSLSDLTKVTEIFRGKPSIYRMRIRDSLLFGYTAQQNFILNLENNKVVMEVAMPKVDRTYYNYDQKTLDMVNERRPFSSFDTENFAADEYIADVDLLPGTTWAVYSTYKGTKFIDLKTKKTVRFIKGTYSLQIKISKDGNRMIGHNYYPYKSIRVYEPKDKNLKLISERQSMGNAIYFPEVSPGKRWLYTNNITSGFLWDLTNFSKYAEVKDISGSDSSSVYRAYFISDSELVVNSTTFGKNINLSVYNIQKKKHTKILKKGVYALASGFMNGEFYFVDYTSLHIVNLKTMAEEKYEGMFSIAASEQYNVINFTPDLVFIPEAGKFRIVNRKSKKTEYQSDNWVLTSRVMISPDSKYVFTSGQVTKKRNINGYEADVPMTSVIRIDMAQKKVVQDYAATFFLYDFKIKNGGKNIGVWYLKHNWGNSSETDKETMYSEYDLETGKELLTKTLAKTPEMLTSHYTSDHGKYFGLGNINNNFFKIFDDKGNEVMDLTDLKIYYPKCFFLEDQDKMILTGFNTSLATFVDLKNKKMIGQLANAKGDQFFLVTSDMHYLGSKEFIKHIRFKYNSEMFSFEQFDAYLNQPHTVLRAFGCSDSALIQAYEKAYLKRMKVLGLKANSKINFAALPNIQYVQMKEDKPGFVNFSISINKGLNKLAKLDVYNNGTLVFSENIPALQNSNYSKSFSFETSSGINRFEFIAKDEVGLESQHIARLYNNTNIVKPNLYLVVIASEKFKDKDFDLAYAVKDAGDVANTMANSKSFGKIEIKKLFNQSFGPDSVAALKNFFAKAGINDVVMVFFAGHGYLDTDLSYYFPTYYTDFSDPKINSVAYKSFEKLFTDMKPTRKLMFIDACFSGEVDEDVINVENDPNKKDKKDSTRTVRFGGISFEQSTAMEMSKSVFSDLRQNTGATIISSAGGTEAAFEGEKWNNGLFTHCLLEGMKEMKADLNRDQKITLSELQKYVGEEVNRLSEGKQTPTYRMENTVLDYELW